jgi:competence protein ComEA
MEKDHTRTRAAILLVSFALLVFFMARSLASVPLPAPEVSSAVVVEVKGNVARPGIYILDFKTATAGFVASMAGRPDIPADMASQKLISGQSLEILGHGAGTTIRLGRMPGAALLTCGLKLDLNSASLGELLLIPHMRSVIANAIVERRGEKEWEQVDDLTEIRGVGPKTVQKLQDYLEASPHCK